MPVKEANLEPKAVMTLSTEVEPHDFNSTGVNVSFSFVEEVSSLPSPHAIKARVGRIKVSVFKIFFIF